MSLPRTGAVVARFVLAILVALFVVGMPTTSVAQNDPLHVWVGKLDKAGAEKWVGDHLAREQKDVDELLAVKAPRTRSMLPQ